MKTNVETVARGKASVHTHQTAPTQFIEVAGIRFAYRRFANRRFGVTIDFPLLFFMHFTGTMDHWDPFPAVAQIRGHVAFYPDRIDEAEQLPT